ncbi:hypothetical protein F511_34687 [Dorcoceras hygrometricum]|uniref:Uncharacterized protein n=1 Tax=Dorcoceras hygrometricum TaxID=472368 RepID=A0A2Z7D430_9LAMI|nr:hypothetical protein F511_34687 [Dorcoceras hygrometricum]
MQNGGIRAEDVIAKLKDDGDFDRLRVKIIRMLKESEEFRGNIISLVRQSDALNSPGALNMKPRQLSDAIHREIGDKLMSQVSDGLWTIIKSADGMRTEITETVQSVYEKMLKPLRDDNCEPSSSMSSLPIQCGSKHNLATSSAGEIGGSLSDREPNEPLGFSLNDRHQNNEMNQMEQQHRIGLHPSSRKRKGKAMEKVRDKNLHSEDFKEPYDLDDAPPGFSSFLEHNKLTVATDEDPDVPPGFG